MKEERYIIDTYAWIEYFKGTEKGRQIKKIIESGENITPVIVLAELKRKYTEWKRTDFEERLMFIRLKSEILPLYESAATLSGEIKANIDIKNISFIDCILIALSRIYEIKVLTGDAHFKYLKEGEYFGD